MPTAISPANFQAALGEAYDAIEADDLELASKCLAKAEIQLNGLPASTSQDKSTTSLRASLKACYEALEVLKRQRGEYRYEIHSRWQT